jgi:hypothetical protein
MATKFPEWASALTGTGGLVAGGLLSLIPGIGMAAGPLAMIGGAVGSAVGAAGQLANKEKPIDFGSQQQQIQTQIRDFSQQMGRGADPNVLSRGRDRIGQESATQRRRGVSQTQDVMRGQGFGPGQQAGLEQDVLQQVDEREAIENARLDAMFAQLDSQTRSENRRFGLHGMQQATMQSAALQQSQDRMNMMQDQIKQRRIDNIVGSIGQMFSNVATASGIFGGDGVKKQDRTGFRVANMSDGLSKTISFEPVGKDQFNDAVGGDANGILDILNAARTIGNNGGI